MESDLEGMNTQEAQTKKLAAQEARHLAQLKAQQASKDAEAERNRNLSDQSGERAKDLRLRFEQQDAGRIERTPIIRRTEDMRTQREVNEAERQEAERAAREKERRTEGASVSRGSGNGDLGATDTAPLTEAAGSTRELTTALAAFADQSISLHGTTASALGQMTTALGELETRVNNIRIS